MRCARPIILWAEEGRSIFRPQRERPRREPLRGVSPPSGKAGVRRRHHPGTRAAHPRPFCLASLPAKIEHGELPDQRFEHLLGGGLGIPYTRSNDAPPLPTDYGALIKRTVGDLGCEIEIEPGRLISGNAGLLVAQVIYVKSGEERDFLILDAAMNDLVRPSMYGAHHDIVPVIESAPGLLIGPGGSPGCM